ncbi:MAG: GNAT family N-acetyltransferase [Bacillota bacterium]
MSIEVVQISISNKEIHKNLKEPYQVFGKLEMRFADGRWNYQETIFEKPYTKIYDENYIKVEEYISNENKTIFYALDNSLCVGQIVIRMNWNRFCFIEGIVVKEKARRKNVGTLLLNTAKNWAIARNLKGFMLEAQDNNLGACRFYIKNGFVLGGVDIMLYNNFQNKDEKALFWYKTF